MRLWLVPTSWAIEGILRDNFDYVQLGLIDWFKKPCPCSCFTDCLIMLLGTKQCIGEGVVGGMDRKDLSVEAWCLHPSLYTGQITFLYRPCSSAEILLSLPSKDMQNPTIFYHLATSTLVQGTLIFHWESFKSLLTLHSLLHSIHSPHSSHCISLLRHKSDPVTHLLETL